MQRVGKNKHEELERKHAGKIRFENVLKDRIQVLEEQCQNVVRNADKVA